MNAPVEQDRPAKFGACLAGQCHGTANAAPCKGVAKGFHGRPDIECGCECHGKTYPAWVRATIVVSKDGLQAVQIRTKRDAGYISRHGGKVLKTLDDAKIETSRLERTEADYMVDRGIQCQGLPVAVIL